MKFFLDTANLDEIQQAFELGIMDGVTTNPALLSKQSGSYKEGVQNIVSLTGGERILPAESAEESVCYGPEAEQVFLEQAYAPAGPVYV